MALGDGNNGNGNSSRVYDSTFYSRAGSKNAETKLRLAYRFRSGLMTIVIAQEKDGFKYDDATYINLSMKKARLFRDKLKEFKKQLLEGAAPDPDKAFGVDAGIGETVSFIAMHTVAMDPDAGINGVGYGLTIGKINSNGEVTDVYDYPFNFSYHYSLAWNNLSAMDVSKEYNDMLELDELITVLDEFVSVSGGATAVSVFDMGRYEINRLMNPIYEKLGIERGRKNNSEGNNGGGYFRNAGATSHQSNNRSIEDLDDLLG